MVTNEPVDKLRNTAAFHGETVAVGADFDTRWAAWIARGEVHDRRVHRRLLVSASVVAIGVVIASAFLA